MPLEKWKQLHKISSGDYLISSLGRIYCRKTAQFIRPSIYRSRANFYLRVSVDRKKFMLHVLVAEAFNPKPDELHKQVDHLDSNTLNPAAYNLEWVTDKENKKRMQAKKTFTYDGDEYKGKIRKTRVAKRVHK